MNTEFLIADSAIRQLHTRAVDATWRKDAQAFAALFVDDGEWKIAGLHIRGRADIEATFAKLLGFCERVYTNYSAPALEVGQGTAVGRTYVYEKTKLATGDVVATIGVYHDWFVERDGGWRFQRRHWSLKYRGPEDFSEPFYDTPDYGPPPGMPSIAEPSITKRAG